MSNSELFQFVMGTDSLEQGMGNIKSYVKKSKDLHLSSLALVDNSTTSAYVKFFDGMKNADIKPILGATVYLDIPYFDNLLLMEREYKSISSSFSGLGLSVMSIDEIINDRENEKKFDPEYFIKSLKEIGNSVDFYFRSKSKSKDEVLLNAISPMLFDMGFEFPSFIDIALNYSNLSVDDKGFYNQEDVKFVFVESVKKHLKAIGFSDKEIKFVNPDVSVEQIIEKLDLHDDAYFVSALKNFNGVKKSFNLGVFVENFKLINFDYSFRNIRLTSLNQEGSIEINRIISDAYQNGQSEDKIKLKSSGDKVKRDDFSYPLASIDAILKSKNILIHSLTVDDDVVFSIKNENIQRLILKEFSNYFEDRFLLGVVRSYDSDSLKYSQQEKNIYNALRYSEDFNIVPYATNLARFVEKEDYEVFDIKSSILTDQWYSSPIRLRVGAKNEYLLSDDELAARFSDLPPILIDNNKRISNVSNSDIILNKNYLPLSPIPEDYAHMILKDEYKKLGIPYSPNDSIEDLENKFKDHFIKENPEMSGLTLDLEVKKEFSNIISKPYLIDKAWSGVERLLKEAHPDTWEEKIPKYKERFQEEVDIICNMGFAGYFLIVHDFIAEAKRREIPVGPGRGSGAGSIVAYGLEITIPDPIEYGLFFERFLNPERVSMPDFDIDFCIKGRAEIIDYVMEKYGRDAVAYIATTGKFKPKSAFNAVLSTLNYTIPYRKLVSSKIPEDPFLTIDGLFEDEEFMEFISDKPTLKNISSTVKKMSDETSQTGVHAGGVVISPTTLSDFSSVVRNPDGSGLSTMFDKDDVEKAGLVKFDFLGLANLTIIKAAIDQIKINHGVDIDIDKVNLKDKKTYALLETAKVQDVFQLSSSGMKDLVSKLKIEDVEDISALVALYRPGPMQSGMLDLYVKRKNGTLPVEYIHPKAESITKNTFGTIIYQEQVMQIARDVAGYSLGAADLLRRAMGKKKPEEMAKQKKVFISGALKLNAADRIKEIYEKNGISVDIELSGDFLAEYKDDDGFISDPEKFDEFLKFIGLSDKEIEVIHYDMNQESFNIDEMIEGYKGKLYPKIKNKLIELNVENEKAGELSTNIYFSLFEHAKYSNIFNVIEKFAGYGFNKAHSLAYAFVAYQTAYLKANYTKEFFAAVLSNQEKLDLLAPTVFDMTHNFNIPLIPHSVNQSDYFYKAADEGVISGLINIRSLGKYGILIEKERKENGDFKNLQDLLFRVNYRNIIDPETKNSKLSSGAFKGLLYSGALDCFIAGDNPIYKMQKRKYLEKEYESVMANYPEDIEILVVERLKTGDYNSSVLDVFKTSSGKPISLVKDVLIKSLAYGVKFEKFLPNMDDEEKATYYDNFLSEILTFNTESDDLISADSLLDLSFIDIAKKDLNKFVSLAKKAPYGLTEKQKDEYGELSEEILRGLPVNMKRFLFNVSKHYFKDEVSDGKTAIELARKSLEMLVNFETLKKIKGVAVPPNFYDIYLAYKHKYLKDKLQSFSVFVANKINSRDYNVYSNVKNSVLMDLEIEDSELLSLEKHYTGGYITMHPVLLNNTIEKTNKTCTPVININDLNIKCSDMDKMAEEKGKIYYVAAAISKIEIKKTKKGGELAILTLSDQSGDYEAVMFSELMENMGEYLKEGAVGSIGLELSVFNDRPSVQVKQVKLHSPDVDRTFSVGGLKARQHKAKVMG